MNGEIRRQPEVRGIVGRIKSQPGLNFKINFGALNNKTTQKNDKIATWSGYCPIDVKNAEKREIYQFTPTGANPNANPMKINTLVGGAKGESTFGGQVS